MVNKTTGSKKTIRRNEEFICEKCGLHNDKAPSGCRNHCKSCLYSKHVDLNLPGDRQSECLGLMEPIAIVTKGKKGHQIMHECLKCGARQVNIVASDDDTDAIIKVMQRQNINPIP